MEEAVQKLREVIWWPWDYRDNALASGMTWPRGVLLHGPAGCGKNAAVETALSRASQREHNNSSVTKAYKADEGKSESCLKDAVAIKLVAATLFSSIAGSCMYSPKCFSKEKKR